MITLKVESENSLGKKGVLLHTMISFMNQALIIELEFEVHFVLIKVFLVCYDYYK